MIYEQPNSETPLALLSEAGGFSRATAEELATLARGGGVTLLRIPAADLAILALVGGIEARAVPGLAALADAGGWVSVWTKFVPMALLPYRCHSWGPDTWQPRCPVPDPEWSLQVEGREADFSLVGFAEYDGFVSTPPRFFGELHFGSQLPQDESNDSWLGHCSLGDASDYNSFTMSIYGTVLLGFAFDDGKKDQWSESGFGACSAFQGPLEAGTFAPQADATGAAAATAPTIPGLNTLFNDPAYYDKVVTNNKVTLTGRGEIPGATVTNDITYTRGEMFEELRAEDLPCPKFEAAVAAVPWGAAVAYTQAQIASGAASAATSTTWKADPLAVRDFAGRQERWTLLASNLVSGREYRARWYEDNVWQEEIFTAVAATHEIVRTVACGASVTDWEVILK